MPKRVVPLINGQYYHVFNRSINGNPIFTNKRILKRALETIKYYKYQINPIRLSYYLRWSDAKKLNLIKDLKKKNKLNITNIAYCFMPNHFHLLLKQESDKGISKFMSNFQNSITRYLNTISNKKGHIFQAQFKAVLIESNEQLLHVTRYIHLNPFSSFLIKSIDQLSQYPWTSLNEYLENKSNFCEVNLVLSNFKNSKKYWEFIEDHSDYQRNLQIIKHLILE